MATRPNTVVGETIPVSPEDPEPAFGSNAIRLSCVQWVIAAAIIIAVIVSIPILWERIEPFEPTPSYRVPYALSNDYWHFARYCRQAAKQDAVLVVGDSVIWGEYVAPTETLSAHLNALSGGERFVNLGVNGIHPVALAGLIAYYGRAIAGKDVLLHYNPLWMSSPRHDLQTDKEFRFNHPELVPQFLTRIPCYKDPYATRFGAVVERYLPLRAWTNHLAIAYFDNSDFPAWAVQHPYENPLKAITLGLTAELPGPDATRDRGSASWAERGITPHRFEWVEADKSFQWRFFQRTVEVLLERGNRVVVLVGPFNEHMIAPESRQRYEAVKRDIEAWLHKQRIPYLMGVLLPSEQYADASHPLREGYALIAKEVLARLARLPKPGSWEPVDVAWASRP